jgi:hypothetical protein
MTAAKPEVLARARAIIEGLMRTQRGSDPHIAGTNVRLRSKIDGSIGSGSTAVGYCAATMSTMRTKLLRENSSS